jgi:DNA-binding XRE family transcriptional regulator
MAKRIFRPRDQTPEQEAEERAIRERFQRERPSREELLASGEYEDTGLTQGEFWELQRFCLEQLRSLRESAGLSLTDMAERTGMDRAAINKLENGVHTNPTISTINRYLHALGKKLVVRVADMAS